MRDRLISCNEFHPLVLTQQKGGAVYEYGFSPSGVLKLFTVCHLAVSLLCDCVWAGSIVSVCLLVIHIPFSQGFVLISLRV